MNEDALPPDEDQRVAADIAYNKAKADGTFQREIERKAILQELSLSRQQNFCGIINPLQ